MAQLRNAGLLAAVLALTPFAASPRAADAPQTAPEATIELREGDRVAFVGDSFFEREYRFGLLETALTLAHPTKKLTFRSLGWTGDTVWGEARAYFGQPSDGYVELMANIASANPTVVFVGYGGNESFAGEAGLQRFLEQYRVLLDELAKRTPRIVLLTPLPHEGATSPLPADRVERRSAEIAVYARAVRDLARVRGLATVDLFDGMRAAITRAGRPLFQNGMHLTEAGYAAAAAIIAARTLPAASAGEFFRRWHGAPTAPEAPVVPTAQAWAPLRDLIVKKNDSFFHRWRPANANYVYLSRRRGGQNTTAQELPKFDPVIVEQEQAIMRKLAELTSGTSTTERVQ